MAVDDQLQPGQRLLFPDHKIKRSSKLIRSVPLLEWCTALSWLILLLACFHPPHDMGKLEKGRPIDLRQPHAWRKLKPTTPRRLPPRAEMVQERDVMVCVLAIAQ